MTTGRSRTIGVIVGDIENPYFGQAVRGISEVATAAGFDVILANSGEDVGKEQAAVRVLLGKRVDGLIVTPASMSETQHLESVQRSGRPLVLLDRAVPGLKVDSVVTDDRAAAKAATQTLIDAGHRRIAYIYRDELRQSDLQRSSSDQSDDRNGPHRGFLGGAAEAGIAIPNNTSALRRQGSEHRARSSPTFCLCPIVQPPSSRRTTWSALEVFKAIRALGMSIPDDLSLIAFHDADWTSVTSPPITVISQPVYDLGMESAQILIKRIKGGGEPPKRLVLATTLIERQSVGAPAVPAGRVKRAKLRQATS